MSDFRINFNSWLNGFKQCFIQIHGYLCSLGVRFGLVMIIFLRWHFFLISRCHPKGSVVVIFWLNLAQSAGDVEYADCFSAEGSYPLNQCPGYDTKQSESEVPVILELWGMRSTPSLPSLPGPHCCGVVAPDRILSTGQTELNCEFMLNWIDWNGTVLRFKLCI